MGEVVLMSFGLRLRKVSRRETDELVRRAAELLGITDKLKSKRLVPRTNAAIDQRIALVAEMEFMHIFDKDTEETVV